MHEAYKWISFHITFHPSVFNIEQNYYQEAFIILWHMQYEFHYPFYKTPMSLVNWLHLQ
jgi:hypothetical protein